MLVLGLDYETTGLSPKQDRVIEVGAVIWDTDKGLPVLVESHYVLLEETIAINPEAMACNGINLDHVSRFGILPTKSLQIQLDLMSEVSAVVAHNGEVFDRLFFNEWCRRKLNPIPTIPWIDTKNDLPYPTSMKTRKLVHLAAEHSFLNPFAHRAVFDVLTMLKIFQGYNPEQALDLCQQPMICLQALVSYQDRAMASDKGYHWHGPSKTWWRSIRESQVAKEKTECNFQVKQIQQPKE
jgi:DNA polymerase-3 subunit epsilon